MPQHLSGTLRRVETQRGGESGPCPSKRRFCFIKKSTLRMLASARLPSFSKYMKEKKNLQLLCFPATPMPWASYFRRRCGGGGRAQGRLGRGQACSVISEATTPARAPTPCWMDLRGGVCTGEFVSSCLQRKGCWYHFWKIRENSWTELLSYRTIISGVFFRVSS